MKFTIAKILHKYTSRKTYIKGWLYITNDVGYPNFRVKEFSLPNMDAGVTYQLNTKSNQLIKGTGYTLYKGEFVKFIGERGVNYSTCKGLFRYRPGDIVMGYIKNNEFYIK